MSSTSSNLILTINEGTKSFNNNVILKNIQMSISEGDFISIVGPSGSGKSTLLKLIAGLGSWTTGRQQENTLISKSFVFQDPNLLSWRTVLQNVLLPLEFKSNKKNILENPTEGPSLNHQFLAKEVLKMVHLESSSQLYPHELSGGMKMRTSLARAFINKPRLLFMDEPFAALDEPTRENLQEHLRSIWEKEKTTIVFVTHSLQEALFLSNRILFLSGKPASIIEEKKVELSKQRSALTRHSNEYFSALNEVRERILFHSKQESHS